MPIYLMALIISLIFLPLRTVQKALVILCLMTASAHTIATGLPRNAIAFDPAVTSSELSFTQARGVERVPTVISDTARKQPSVLLSMPGSQLNDAVYLARASQAETPDPALTREVQDYLKRLGFFQGTVDGVLGRDTTQAISQFRVNVGLKPSRTLTPEVIELLRERVKAATPQGRLLARQGQLEAYVGPARWCKARVRVILQAPAPMAYQQDSDEFQSLISQLQVALRHDCPRAKQADIVGMVDDTRVYVAVLDSAGTLKVRQSPTSLASRQAISQQQLAAERKRSACATADPQSYDQVFACMSSARWTHGLSAGRNRFEGNIGTSSCRTIAATYVAVLSELAGLARDEAGKRMPSCEFLARAAQEITGKPAYWTSCVGYGSQPAEAHMTQCLEGFIPRYYGAATAVAQKVTGCATAIAEYELGLAAASNRSRLPNDYRRPSCEAVFAMIAHWTGAPALAAACTGYDPDKVAAHLDRCLGQELPLASLHTCQEVRRLYEALLLEAHGGFPENYRMLACSATGDLLARAAAERAEIAEQKRVAALEQQRRHAEIQTARQSAVESKKKRRQEKVQAELDRAEQQFSKIVAGDGMATGANGSSVTEHREWTEELTPEQAKQLAQQAAITLNNSEVLQGDGTVIAGADADLSKINQARFQPIDPLLMNAYINDPVSFFWNTMGNELAKARAGATQISNISREIRRHTRNLHVALEICCSCKYRKELLEEFVEWKSEEIWNEKLTKNAMGALQGSSPDFSQLVPSRDIDKNKVLETAPKPCKPPAEFGEPKVSDEPGLDGALHSRAVDWGYVPDGFFLPSPSYKPNQQSILYRAHVQVPGRLRAAVVERFQAGSLVGDSQDYSDIAGTEKLISQDIEFARKQGAYVLHCYYLRSDYLGSKRFFYWFRDRPQMIEPDYLQRRVPNHLLLQVGEPMDSCPLGIKAAETMSIDR